MTTEFTRRYVLLLGACGTAVLAGCPSSESTDTGKTPTEATESSSETNQQQAENTLVIRSDKQHKIEQATTESYQAVTIHNSGALQLNPSGALRLNPSSE